MAEPGEERSGPAADDGHAGAEDEQEGEDAEAAGDEEGEEPQYEITVDGTPTTVSLGELRDGYIRTATFHSRLNKVNEGRAVVEQENARVTQLRDLYVQGLQFLDEDLRGIMPVEPDWEAEFTRDPANAHRMQKDFQKFHAKLNQISTRTRPERFRTGARRTIGAARNTRATSLHNSSRIIIS